MTKKIVDLGFWPSPFLGLGPKPCPQFQNWAELMSLFKEIFLKKELRPFLRTAGVGSEQNIRWHDGQGAPLPLCVKRALFRGAKSSFLGLFGQKGWFLGSFSTLGHPQRSKLKLWTALRS